MHVNLDPLLVDKIANEVKSQGVFDQFRKDSMADVDTKPAYQNLRQRVENTVNKFLSAQMWTPEMNKNQLRERLRKHITEAGFLDVGVERIVDQVVNPKIATVFQPKIEDIAYKYLGIPKPQPTVLVAPSDVPPMNGVLKVETDLLPTDLEQVSPDSDKGTNKSDSKDEMDIDEKLDDFESPAFEPIENSNLYKEKFESKSEPVSEDVKDIKTEIVEPPAAPETHSFPFKKYQPQVKEDSSSEDWDAEEKKKPEPPKVENVAPVDVRDVTPEEATQDTQLSQVSSDSRLSIVTNGNTQDDHSTACEIKEENNVNISEEAQMPKFSENSNSCSDQKPSEPLHFDIKKDEIKFEGTERKAEPPPSADASPNISDEQRVDSSMENKTIDTSETSDIPLPSHEFSFEKDSDFKFSKIEVKVEHLEEATKTTSLDDSADRELQIIEKSEMSQCSMSQASAKSPMPKPKSPSATSSPVPQSSHHKSSHREREREHSSSSSRHKKYYSSKDRRSDRDRERERERERDKDKDKHSSSSHKQSSSSSRNHHSSSKSSSSQKPSGGGGGTPSDPHHRSSSSSVHKSSKSSSSSSRYSKSSRSHNDGKDSHRSRDRDRDRDRERERDRSKSRSDKSRDKSSKDKSERSKPADDHYSSKQKWRKSTDSNDEDSSQEGSQSHSRGGPKEANHSQDNANTNGTNNNNSNTSSGTSNANNVNGKAGSSAVDTLAAANPIQDTNPLKTPSAATKPKPMETETASIETNPETTTCPPHNNEFLFYFESEPKAKEQVEIRLNILTNMMENFRNILKTSMGSSSSRDPSTTETTESESGHPGHATDSTSVGNRNSSMSPKQSGNEEGALTSATLTIDCIQYDNPSISHCLSKRFKYDEQVHTKISPTPSDLSVNSKENEFLDKNSQSDSDSLGSGSRDPNKTDMNKSISSSLKRKAIINRNQRYSSEDLYKPRPILSQRSRRRGLDAVI